MLTAAEVAFVISLSHVWLGSKVGTGYTTGYQAANHI